MRAKAPTWTGMNATEKQLIPHTHALFHQNHLSDTYTVTSPQLPVTK